MIVQKVLSDSPISDYEELYTGSKLSSSESHILILAFVQRYKLSKKGTEDLHELINLHVPKKINLTASNYMLKKQEAVFWEWFSIMDPLAARGVCIQGKLCG
ncbi:unnamed protein product [Allacma fusca]|uniref:Uncharacterized protein n=1 Tax=Allacma fusca TaxID=39272 RepID=A0A8J2NNS5_9HEXA|nr:unnamed protein product [Allacma fusca]